MSWPEISIRRSFADHIVLVGTSAAGVVNDLQAHPDRTRRPGGGDPRPAARGDPAGGVSRSARLGGRSRTPVHAARRDRSDPRPAAHRRHAERAARRRLGSRRVRDVLARLQARPAADRPGLSVGGDHARLPRGLTARLSADRGATARNQGCLLALHVAALCRRARRPSRKAQARRRGAHHDDHVLRHPRVYRAFRRSSMRCA